MNKLVYLSSVALLLFMIVPCTAQDKEAPAQSPEAKPKPINLQPEFVEGRNSRFELWSSRETVAAYSIGGRRREITSFMELTGESSWTVESVNPDGTAECVMTVEWLKITTRSGDGGEPKENDSREATGDDKRMHQLLKAIANKAIRVQCNADGSIASAAGFEGVKDELDDPDDAPDETDWIRDATDMATLSGAPASLMVDAGWNKDFTWNHEAGKMHHAANFKLASVESIAGIPVATVTGTSQIRFEADMSKFPNGGDGIRIEMTDGSFEQQVMFDLQRHEAVGRNSIEKRTIRMTRHSGNVAITQEINESIQSQILRIVEED